MKKYQESCRGTEAAEKGNIQISDVNLNVFGTEYPRLVPSTWLILGLYLGNTDSSREIHITNLDITESPF